MSDFPSQQARQDLITQTWVVCAPTRGHRPHDIDEANDRDPTDRTPVEGCPFCPGHEAMLPGVIWELDATNGSPWQTRVVPNKYPAMTPEASSEEQQCGLYHLRGGHGHQEVIIDTPYHYRSMAHMAVNDVDAVLQTYLARYRHYREADGDLIPHIFRNHGTDAGASLPHPHSQLIATPLPPPHIEQEEAQARALHAETGRCPYCEMVEEELRAEARLVFVNDDFVVFVPYAARAPFTQWILPRAHEPELGRLDGAQRRALADALHEATRRLHQALGDPDYNFFFRTALQYASEAPHLHWSLRIRPRTTVDAGFELSTGLRINPSLPERDAEVLRSIA
jgi:UDPglucose--hexose-1-phosphate uridylyltransferase